MTTLNTAPISPSFFGMTLQSLGYNFSYLGGPVEASPTIPVGVMRSWDVWTPGNGKIGYLDWADLNPAAGVFNWSTLDSWIAVNQANKTPMVYTFGNAPAWAGGVTTNIADFQAFVTAMVTEANGAIKYWEGFNEFDVSGIAPALLVQLQKIIYNTVHTLDPGGVVLSPTVCAPGDDPQFAQFLADGGGQYLDVAAFHGYNNSTGEGLITVVQDLQATLSQYGLASVPMWDTEWGMEAPTIITDTTAQEAYVSTGLILQAALGVQTEIFYAYDSANSALYNRATGQLTPAGVAYQQTEQWLAGATLPTGYQLNGSVYTVQLLKNGQNELIVWNSGGPSSYAAGPYTLYVDAQGLVHSVVNGVVTIATVPILLESTVPTVLSGTASGTGISGGTGDLGVGKTVTLTLNLTEAVTVSGGTPTLTLNDGGVATYSGGSGTPALTFTYTVAAGQNALDLAVTAVNLNAATIADTSGNVANLAGAVTALAGTLQIDTTPPTAPVITNDTVNGNTVALIGTAEAGSTVTVYNGQTVLGAVQSSAGGTWSFTIGALPIGSYAFTATATDAAGNVSALSAAIDPTVGAFTGTQSGTLSVANGTTLDITGTVNNTGTIALDASGQATELAALGSTTLTGGGKVVLSNNANNEIGSTGTAATLTNVSETISGGGTIGDAYLSLANQGTINASNAQALILNTGANAISNSGLLEGTSTGGLYIESNVGNSKTIGAIGTNAKLVIESTITDTTNGLILASGSAAHVDLNNATIVGGRLQTSGRALIDTVAGTIDLLDGISIISGSTIQVNAGSTLTTRDSVTNAGTIMVNGGVLNVTGTLAGGTTKIAGSGKMVIAQSNNENIAFMAGSTGEVVLDDSTSYTGQISGLGTTQSVDLADISYGSGVTMSYTSTGWRNSSGILTITNGTHTTKLAMQGGYTLANFRLVSDGAGGTLLTDPTVITQAPGNASATIGNDTVLEINTPDKGSVTFTGTTGSLWLDQSPTFSGKVSGLGAHNVIDLPGIAFSAQTTLGYSSNSNKTGGTLSLTDGVHSAKIALLGSYMASSFVMESDNHGGTMVLADVAQSANQPLLTHPQHP